MACRAEGVGRGNPLWTVASTWRFPASKLMLLSCCYLKLSEIQTGGRRGVPVKLALKQPWGDMGHISACDEMNYLGLNIACVVRKAWPFLGRWPRQIPSSLERNWWMSSTWHQPCKGQPRSHHASRARFSCPMQAWKMTRQMLLVGHESKIQGKKHISK